MDAEPGELDQVLQRTKDRYQLLAENVSDVIFTLDLNLRYTYCSPSVERLRGYTAAEVMSQTLEQVLTPASYQVASKMLEEALAGQRANPGLSFEPQTLELELTRKGGGTVWAEVKVSLLRDERGDAVGILGVSRDISERRRARDRLRKQRQIFFSVLEKAPYGVVLIETDNTCFYVNRAFQEITGYTLDDIPTGRSWFQKAYPDEVYRKKVISAWKKDLLDRELTRTFRVRCKDQTLKDVEFKSAVLDDGRTVTMLSDVTERVEAEKEKAALEFQLRQAQKMEAVGTLSAGIAHDFKNVLTAVEGFANLAIKHAPEKSKAKRYLDQILRAVERANELVGQILMFSHKGEDELKPIELIPIIKESMGMLRASLRPTIALKERFATEWSLVLADATQVQQIIINLATNAAYAMGRKEGTLTVELSDFTVTRRNAPVPEMTVVPYLRLTISDTGAGMDAQTVERVFDPFFTTKKRTEGTGLGLWVVHSIVKKHRGAITVRSSPGQGSAFDVFFPCVIG